MKAIKIRDRLCLARSLSRIQIERKREAFIGNTRQELGKSLTRPWASRRTELLESEVAECENRKWEVAIKYLPLGCGKQKLAAGESIRAGTLEE